MFLKKNRFLLFLHLLDVPAKLTGWVPAVFYCFTFTVHLFFVFIVFVNSHSRTCLFLSLSIFVIKSVWLFLTHFNNNSRCWYFHLLELFNLLLVLLVDVSHISISAEILYYILLMLIVSHTSVNADSQICPIKSRHKTKENLISGGTSSLTRNLAR